jgi:hypothetical protein
LLSISHICSNYSISFPYHSCVINILSLAVYALSLKNVANFLADAFKFLALEPTGMCKIFQ